MAATTTAAAAAIHFNAHMYDSLLLFAAEGSPSLLFARLILHGTVECPHCGAMNSSTAAAASVVATSVAVWCEAAEGKREPECRQTMLPADALSHGPLLNVCPH